MSTSKRTLRTLTLGVVAIGLLAAPVACGGDDDAKKDPAATCTGMCTGAGFTAGRADVQPNELNCFCTGGSGTVSAAACTTLCSDLEAGAGAPFSGSGGPLDACQCDGRGD